MCISVRDSYNILRDVTDRERLSASLKAFLAVTMQDMLMPVTLVQTASQLLSQLASVRASEEAQFLVGAISAASRLLNGIVSNVLSLRALEAGECSIVAAPFSVRDAVAGVLSVCSTTFTARPLRWTDEHEHLPARALGDGDRLAQILLNLLTNAAKVADGSEVTVSVRIEPRGDSSADASAALLTLVVADSGRGMSAEECARAFEPYYRAPSHRGGGTGLGLYIGQRFSQALGGSLSVQSAPGRGARFELSVPVGIAPPCAADVPASENAPPPPAQAAPAHAEPAQTVPAPAAAEPLAPPTPERGASAARRLRVLLVEDHPLNAVRPLLWLSSYDD
jgi:signal transduction histidine kinase